jgi:hypothetical protein
VKIKDKTSILVDDVEKKERMRDSEKGGGPRPSQGSDIYYILQPSFSIGDDEELSSNVQGMRISKTKQHVTGPLTTNP